jgi:hypothetical protein
MPSDDEDSDIVEIVGTKPPPTPTIKPNDHIFIQIGLAFRPGTLINYTKDNTKAVVKYSSNETGVVGIDQIKPAFNAITNSVCFRKKPKKFIKNIVYSPKKTQKNLLPLLPSWNKRTASSSVGDSTKNYP